VYYPFVGKKLNVKGSRFPCLRDKSLANGERRVLYNQTAREREDTMRPRRGET